MPISREKKEQVVADLTEKLSRSQALIMTDFRGLNTTEMNELRHKLRETETGYHVVKNSLIRLALERSGLPWEQSLFDGPTAVGFCYEDVSSPAKIMSDFAKESTTFSIRGGVLGQKVVSAAQISKLAALPSSEVLIAQAVGGMKAPLISLVSVLSAPLHNLARVLQARSQQLAESRA
jgi:large subunit ribosomal protein L10